MLLLIFFFWVIKGQYTDTGRSQDRNLTIGQGISQVLLPVGDISDSH